MYFVITFITVNVFFRTFHFEVNNILTLIQNVYLTRFDFEVNNLLGLCCVCGFFLSSSCVLHAQYCQFLRIVHS